MAYTNTAALSARLGADMYARLTDRVDGKLASATVAQQLIDEAEAQLDSHLARRFATPVSTSGNTVLASLLAGRALDVAEYLAWRGSPFVGDVPERVRVLYDETIRWLQHVADGRLELPAPQRPAGSSTQGAITATAGTPRTLTHEELRGL